MRYLCVCLALFTTALLPQAAQPAEPATFAVRGGMVKFLAATNISGVTVHGQSAAMKATFQMKKEGESLNLLQLQAALDPKSLSTGMGLRDNHMRSRIFTAENNTIPELVYEFERAACPAPQSSQDVTCQVSGQLRLRGNARPFAIQLKIRKDNKTGGYRVNGDGTVKLTTFGVEPPCQLGVCVLDDVKLQFEFQAQPDQSIAAGGRE